MAICLVLHAGAADRSQHCTWDDSIHRADPPSKLRASSGWLTEKTALSAHCCCCCGSSSSSTWTEKKNLHYDNVWWQWIAGTRRGTARVPPQVFPHSSGFGVCKGEIAQSAIYFTFTAHRFDSVSVNLLWRGPVSVRLLFETEKTWLSLLHVSVTEFTDTRERDTRVAM